MSGHLPRRGGRLARWPRLQRAAAWVRRIYNPELRAIHRLRGERADELLQPFADTRLDRHPALFAFARNELAQVSKPRILSFGCSTGEEPLTLARYFPAATIDAIDINPRSIAQAQALIARFGAANVSIALAAKPPSPPACYDAIFCLSVLRHGELDAFQPQLCSAILPFSRFAETVAALDAILVPGGLLFIWGSNFRFADLQLADRYEFLTSHGQPPHPGAVYGADDRLIDQEGNADFVFRKLGPAQISV